MDYEEKLFEIFYQSSVHQSLTLNGVDASTQDMAQFRRDRLKQFRNWRKNPDAFWIVVERDGMPVAYAATDYNKTFNQLGVGDLCVDEKYRGQGIAKELLEKIEAKAKELGATSIFLGVNKNNKEARALYEKYGFAYEENMYLDMKKVVNKTLK